MKYKYILENANFKISLHDCEIKDLAYKEGSFHIYFPEGLFLDGETRTEKNAEIIIKNLCIEDVDFVISKSYRLIRGRYPFYITRYKSVKDIRKMIKKGYYFTIINEYYQNGEIFWKGEVESIKNHKIKTYGCFEFIFYSDRLLYCFNGPDQADKHE